MNKILHDPEHFEAKTLDESIQKLHCLNSASHHVDDWGKNIYLASKDLDEKFQEDFIRYLANPAGVSGTVGKEIEKNELKNLSEEHPTIDYNTRQKYTLCSSKNKNEYTVRAWEIETHVSVPRHLSPGEGTLSRVSIYRNFTTIFLFFLSI